jgi:hypothetical protein
MTQLGEEREWSGPLPTVFALLHASVESSLGARAPIAGFVEKICDFRDRTAYHWVQVDEGPFSFLWWSSQCGAARANAGTRRSILASKPPPIIYELCQTKRCVWRSKLSLGQKRSYGSPLV